MNFCCLGAEFADHFTKRHLENPRTAGIILKDVRNDTQLICHR